MLKCINSSCNLFKRLAFNLGCFSERGSHLRYYDISSGLSYNELDVTGCREACDRGGYMYAAMTQGSVCFCGGEDKPPIISNQVDETVFCNIPCPRQASTYPS